MILDFKSFPKIEEGVLHREKKREQSECGYDFKFAWLVSEGFETFKKVFEMRSEILKKLDAKYFSTYDENEDQKLIPKFSEVLEEFINGYGNTPNETAFDRPAEEFQINRFDLYNPNTPFINPEFG